MGMEQGQTKDRVGCTLVGDLLSASTVNDLRVKRDALRWEPW